MKSVPPVASPAVCSKAVVLLSFFHCLLLLPLFEGLNVRSLLCFAVLFVVSSYVIVSLGKRGTGGFAFVVFWVLCRFCHSLNLPRGAVGRSVECDCGISWSYLLFSNISLYLNENQNELTQRK